MTIISEDGEMGVDFGGYEFWQSLFSTIMKLYVNDKKAIPQTTDFFTKIKCKKGKINELLLELSDIRNKLISEPIDSFVYDVSNCDIKPKWFYELSKDVKNCFEIFTTPEGEYTIDEFIQLLEYARAHKIGIVEA